MTSTGDSLRAQREELVLRHIDAENRNDAQTALDTFTRPKYDLRAVEGDVVEGADGVRALIESFSDALPSITYVADKIHHADHAVIVEYRITGRHDGTYNGVPPSGVEVNYPAIAVYEFDGTDLVCERIYINLRGLEDQMRG
jgi:steroid delta-isomerase-like uncharacterized protein